ncbi:MAG: hypothetical protein LBQ90_03960 [Synergistaceae bacterium]|nr:hypothetical protein [Synergistaceae bacterium]
MKLNVEQEVETLAGYTVRVLGDIGEGGQGVVYRAGWRLGSATRESALKWYPSENPTAQNSDFFHNLQRNVASGPPDANAFLWPLDITKKMDDGSYGYVMKLAPANYAELKKILRGRVPFASLSAIINTARNMAKSFALLHGRGYSYQDMNAGNFFIDPQSGDVLICDNDNVAPYGTNCGIGGAPGYMAPEVVTRVKSPDIHTDRFSMAVVLFRAVFIDHPLRGRRVSDPNLTPEERDDSNLCGRNPIFIFDPADGSNRPIPGTHVNALKLWPLYPKFVRDAFLEAFSRDVMTGARMEHRKTEEEWIDLFLQLRDITVPCEACGAETFIDPDEPQNRCVECGRAISKLPELRFRNRRVPLCPGAKLYKHQIDAGSDDCTTAVGEVFRHKQYPDRWAIKNQSGFSWTCGERTILDGGMLPLIAGSSVAFGDGGKAEILMTPGA